MSHLTRGAWIEIRLPYTLSRQAAGRTSHEVRGLKFPKNIHEISVDQSHLTRGAWIEISRVLTQAMGGNLSHLTRGAWIEITKEAAEVEANNLSHLTRGAWIEIFLSPLYVTS